jgi:neutral ceramidase
MAMQPNFKGMRDETIRMFLASAEANRVKPLGVLWNYACHPVSTYPDDTISSDYPGTVRRLLRERFQEDLPVVFLPGFSGNIRPNRIAKFPLQPYPLLRRMINGPVFDRFSAESSDAWRHSLGGLVSRAAAFALHPVEANGIRSSMLTVPLDELMYGDVRDKFIIFKLTQLDPHFTFLGMSAEPVIEYIDALRGFCTPRTLIPIGYTGAVAAYLPTSEIVAEGGLEAISPGYGLENARYRENVSELVNEQMRKLFVAAPSRPETV